MARPPAFIVVTGMLLFSGGLVHAAENPPAAGAPPATWQAYEDGRITYSAGDFTRAAERLAPLGDAGFAPAQSLLGTMYLNGEGVAQDDAKALILFQKAADQGDADAEFALGILYRHGRGVAEDDALAVAWWTKAAEQAHIQAQINLGIALTRGRGAAVDYVQAYKWFRVAYRIAINPDVKQTAADCARYTASLMTAAQIEEAQKLADEWKPASPAP